MSEQGFFQTGQITCHDPAGKQIPCAGSGQDGEFGKGIPWPEPRFHQKGEMVSDLLTGLDWTKDANPAEFPLTWTEALQWVAEMNRERAFGFEDWRLPNRRELRSLLDHQTRKPILSIGHPFQNVFQGWYWTSTTAVIQPSFAWYVHLEGGRMFYGGKNQAYLLWPVRGKGSGLIPATGQKRCFDSNGNEIPCQGTGQDGEFRFGASWPEPRFILSDECVLDRLTDLCWLKKADLTGKALPWDQALRAVEELNRRGEGGPWRLPNINELESLVDADRYGPALPSHHPFLEVREEYWSSTTSIFEPDWAYALYLQKGAVGVGQKKGPYFYVWPVRDADTPLVQDPFR
ncbi:MAG: DUF1566 domain-containing protein [Thermodesulfobacteriota bacterium]